MIVIQKNVVSLPHQIECDMKKFILGVIVGACVMMAVDYCSTTHVAKDTPQQPKKGEMITWMKLDTLMYDNPKFMAVYPNYFKVDSLSGDSNVKLFTYSEDEDTIRLRCFAVGNSNQWNTEATADSIVSIRKFLKTCTLAISIWKASAVWRPIASMNSSWWTKITFMSMN